MPLPYVPSGKVEVEMNLLGTLLVAVSASITGPDSGFAFDPVATWSYSEQGSDYSISVDANGRCTIAAYARETGHSAQLACGYWMLGSRMYLRIKHPTMNGRPVVELEYLRGLDQLVLPGDRPLIFDREPLDYRNE